MVKRKNLFNDIPNELKIKIYKFDNTYKIIFNFVLNELLLKLKIKKLKNILYPHPFIIMFF
jgi:hypothetical protein